jgi:hypothetical protein
MRCGGQDQQDGKVLVRREGVGLDRGGVHGAAAGELRLPRGPRPRPPARGRLAVPAGSLTAAGRARLGARSARQGATADHAAAPVWRQHQRQAQEQDQGSGEEGPHDPHSTRSGKVLSALPRSRSGEGVTHSAIRCLCPFLMHGCTGSGQARIDFLPLARRARPDTLQRKTGLKAEGWQQTFGIRIAICKGVHARPSSQPGAFRRAFDHLPLGLVPNCLWGLANLVRVLVSGPAALARTAPLGAPRCGVALVIYTDNREA